MADEQTASWRMVDVTLRFLALLLNLRQEVSDILLASV